MPRRKTPLVSKEIYHVFNRSVAQQTIFNNKWEYNYFLESLEYYMFSKTPFRYSHHRRLNSEEKNNLLDHLYKSSSKLVNIFTFCLMPNHFHILARQTSDNGISNHMRLVQNSYAKYKNIKSKRFGALFQSPFKVVRIENDEQFLHVARYIHLNPLTSYLLKNENLDSYIWSSWKDYVSDNPRPFLSTKMLSKLLKKDKLRSFTFDQLDYQRKLDNIKHLILE